MTFEKWCEKNDWEFKSETKCEKECLEIPKALGEDFKDLRTKLFSIKVNNDDTVETINKIKEEYGDFCIEYVLRNGAYTEIVYKDCYLEI